MRDLSCPLVLLLTFGCGPSNGSTAPTANDLAFSRGRLPPPTTWSAMPSVQRAGASFERFGYSATWAGDLDGDGHLELAVSAIEAGPSGSTSGTLGRVEIYRGSAVGLSPSPDWSWTGSVADTRLGTAIAPAGDVNGDGFDDLLIASKLATVATIIEAGRVELHLGGPRGPSSTPSQSWVGTTARDRFGTSLAGVGDVNADGYADVLIGSILASYDGRVDLHLGGPGGLSVSPGWSLNGGAGQYEHFGFSVFGIGDMEGDGYADFAVGAPNYGESAPGNFDGIGRVDVFSGGASLPSFVPTSSLYGTFSEEWFGSALAAGDINADGFTDLAVGAPGYGYSSGLVRVYPGSVSGFSYYAYTELANRSRGGDFGASIAYVGDLDQDGYGDLAVGAPISGSGFSGAVNVFSGGASGPVDPPGVTTLGTVTETFGFSLSGTIAGAPPSLLIGAPRVYSSAGTPIPTRMALYIGAGLDVDGDGFPPVGEVGATDCDESDAAILPGAPELCDGVDTDCDGRLDPPSCYGDSGETGVPDTGLVHGDTGTDVVDSGMLFDSGVSTGDDGGSDGSGDTDGGGGDAGADSAGSDDTSVSGAGGEGSGAADGSGSGEEVGTDDQDAAGVDDGAAADEGGASPGETKPSGCGVTGPRMGKGGYFLVALAVLLVWRRRRRGSETFYIDERWWGTRTI